MIYLGVLALHYVWAAAVGWIYAADGPRQAVAIALGIGLLSLGILAPDPPGFRFIVALGGIMVVFRVVDLVRDRREHPTWLRILLFVHIPDSREGPRHEPAFVPKMALRALGFGLLITLALFAVDAAGDRLLLRWAAGLVAAYAGIETAASLVWMVHRAAGWDVKPFLDDPILSRSVAELWSKRWNRIVHDWLARHVFRPVARRRGAVTGMLATFVFSALFHAWLAGVAVGWVEAALMGSFFLVMGAAVLVERRLPFVRRGGPAARAWTVAVMVGASPLFVEPMLRCVGL